MYLSWKVSFGYFDSCKKLMQTICLFQSFQRELERHRNRANIQLLHFNVNQTQVIFEIEKANMVHEYNRFQVRKVSHRFCPETIRVRKTVWEFDPRDCQDQTCPF